MRFIPYIYSAVLRCRFWGRLAALCGLFLQAQCLSAATVLEYEACESGLPAAEFRCATLVAEGLTGQPFRLQVVIAYPGSMPESQQAVPILFVHGGPGYPLGLDVEGARYWRQWAIDRGWQQPVVMFDQRGTGQSSPAYACHEYDQIAETVLTEKMSAEREFALWQRATGQCRQRIMTAGFRPEQFSSKANAQDVRALMQALGHAQWDVYGVSYGSRVVLELLQEPPKELRRVVLDSVLPLNKEPLDELPFLLGDGLQRVFKACAADQSCHAMLPNPQQRLLGLLAQLRADPVVVKVDHPRGGQLSVVVNDRRLLESLLHASYSVSYIQQIPRILHETRLGGAQQVAPLVQNLVNWVFDDMFSDPIYYAIACAQRSPEGGPIRYAQAARVYPEYAPYIRDLQKFDMCLPWGVAPQAIDGQPEFSWRGAMLILSGVYDPVTPFAWAEQVQQALPGSFLYRSKAEAHAVLAVDVCAKKVVNGFLAAKSAVLIGENGQFQMPECASVNRGLNFDVPLK